MTNFNTHFAIISFIAVVLVIVYIYFLIQTIKRMNTELQTVSKEHALLKKDFEGLLQNLNFVPHPDEISQGVPTEDIKILDEDTKDNTEQCELPQEEVTVEEVIDENLEN